MLQERFNEIKNANDITIYEWFDYYHENGGKLLIIDFMTKFAYIYEGKISLIKNMGNKSRYLNLSTAFSRFSLYYTIKFNDNITE